MRLYVVSEETIRELREQIPVPDGAVPSKNACETCVLAGDSLCTEMICDSYGIICDGNRVKDILGYEV